MHRRKAAESDDGGPVLSVAEANRCYKGQWVMMRATEVDEREKPVAGEVLGVWPQSKESARAIRRKFGHLARTVEPDTGPYFLFHARPEGRPRPPDDPTGELIAHVVTAIAKNRARRAL